MKFFKLIKNYLMIGCCLNSIWLQVIEWLNFEFIITIKIGNFLIATIMVIIVNSIIIVLIIEVIRNFRINFKRNFLANLFHNDEDLLYLLNNGILIYLLASRIVQMAN